MDLTGNRCSSVPKSFDQGGPLDFLQRLRFFVINLEEVFMKLTLSIIAPLLILVMGCEDSKAPQPKAPTVTPAASKPDTPAPPKPEPVTAVKAEIRYYAFKG